MKYTEKSFLGTQNNRIAYSDWGHEDASPIICVHGLTGNGFDFDFLAPHLVEDGYRVIAVDLPGRGRSDFHNDPLHYNYDQYVMDLRGLLAHLGLASVDWLGVSLGGLLGIRMAGQSDSPIKRMIINDVGPVVPKEALEFIHAVISKEYTFADMAEFEARLRASRGLTWGKMSDEHWAHMAKTNARLLPDGRLTYRYDPQIAKVFETSPIGDIDLWQRWEAITCPVQLIHGAQSMLLTAPIIEEMRARGPRFTYNVFEGCGHVPSLWADDQIESIRAWLSAT